MCVSASLGIKEMDSNVDVSWAHFYYRSKITTYSKGKPQNILASAFSHLLIRNSNDGRSSETNKQITNKQTKIGGTKNMVKIKIFFFFGGGQEVAGQTLQP